MRSTDGPFDAKGHWENIHRTKGLKEVSWYQAIPEVSLALLDEHQVRKDARIIDVGGGDSLLVDHLLQRSFSAITVLDISSAALAKARLRLGERSAEVEWIESDATDLTAVEPFDVWHDRAVFHFLTNDRDAERYLRRVADFLRPGGLLILGTFSDNGPEKCSGIPVHRYSEAEMVRRLQSICERIKCITVDHMTPFNTVQNFLFCAFRKRA